MRSLSTLQVPLAAIFGLLCLAPGVSASAQSEVPVTPLADDGMRCGQRLVSVGDTKVDVRDKCGKAEFEDTRYESRTTRDGRQIWVQIDEWIYSLERYQFRRIVTFEGGRVSSIEAGSRVR